jgi:hypothetical protein
MTPRVRRYSGRRVACEREIADDRDREFCYAHDPRTDIAALGTPSESLKGNQNAVGEGNSGGGAP